MRARSVVEFWILLGVLLAVAGPCVCAREVVAPALPRFDPRLGAYLRSQGFTQQAVSAAVAAERRDPLPGDAVAAWVSTVEDNQVRQWLLLIRRVATAAGAKGEGRQIHLSWGPVVSFSSQPEQLELELVGPVVAGPEGQDVPIKDCELPVKRERVEFPGDYLRLGFVDRVALGRKMERVQRAHPEIKRWHLYSLTKPIKPEALAEAREFGALMSFTSAEDRAFAGCGVALQALLKLGMETPGLKDICLPVVNRPSLFQMARMLTGSFTRTTFGTAVDSHGIAGDETDRTHAYRVPVSVFFEKDQLAELSLLVVEPRPPLDLCAGAVGCIAVNPKDVNKVVQVLVIGAKNGR